MKIAALSLAALVVGSPRTVAVPVPSQVGTVEVEEPFVPSVQTFASAATCSAHLARIVRASAPPAYDAAVGPYTIAAGDTRAHRVKARHWGHEIEEFRCTGAGLASRRWTHSMSEVKPFTMEEIGNMSFPAR